MEDAFDGSFIMSFRDLPAWRAGMDLVMSMYRLTQSFPEHELTGLGSQIRCAAITIPAKIANGHARESTSDFLEQLSISEGSLAELETHLAIAGRLGYVSGEQLEKAMRETSSLTRQMYQLRDHVLRVVCREPEPPADDE